MPEDWKFKGWRVLDDAVTRYEELLGASGMTNRDITARVEAARQEHDNLVFALLVRVERPDDYYTRRDPRFEGREVYRAVITPQGWFVLYEVSDRDKRIGVIEVLDAGPGVQPVSG
jgi:hypothetical protein